MACRLPGERASAASVNEQSGSLCGEMFLHVAKLLQGEVELKELHARLLRGDVLREQLGRRHVRREGPLV